MRPDKLRRLTSAAVAGAIALAATSPGHAYLYWTRPDFSGAQVRGDEPGIALPLPNATPAEIQANLVWTMRAALNVAALSCRTRNSAGVAPAYNRMLVRYKAVLAAANAAEEAPFRARYGAKWAGPYDVHATKLYNFFAMPTAQGQFCVTAAQVLARTSALGPDALTGYAPAALAQLETPFLKRPGYARR